MLTRLLSYPSLIYWLIAGSTLLHLIIATHTPLTVDEAHYALYGMHLDWSYFDHPPLVGWLQYLILQWVGEQEWQLRLWAMLCYALSLWLIYRYTLSTYTSHEAANLAALLFTSLPIVHLLGIALVPDTLLLPLTIALVWQAQRTLHHPSWHNWLLIGILLGISALSKYTSVLFALGLLLILLSQPSYRLWLWRSKFWLAVIVAGVISLPVLYWNWQHQWISIIYQVNHGQPDRAFNWLNIGRSQLAQLLAYGPFVWWLSWYYLSQVVNKWQNDNQRVFTLFVLPAILMFTLSSGKEPSLPHWLAFFYTLSLPFVSHSFISHHATHYPSRWIVFALSYGTLITLLLALLVLQPRLTQTQSPNPTQDLIGWRSAAEQALAFKQADESLLVSHWVDASRIAWYARPNPVIVMDQRYDQFDLWFGSPNTRTKGIFILPADKTNLRWQDYFQQCQLLKENTDHFRFYRCTGSLLTAP